MRGGCFDQSARKALPIRRSFPEENVMTTLAESLGEIKKPWQWIVIGGGILLVWGMLAAPMLKRTRDVGLAKQRERSEATAQFDAAMPVDKARPAFFMQQREVAEPRSAAASAGLDATAGRKIVRTSSMEVVAQDPAEAASRITAMAESLGGYLVSSDGGQNASPVFLAIRVPAAQFETARAGIHKLGLPVEKEKIEAEDVTRRYVDEDASIRNLRAEESQYLTIMKQATTVKDMLAVSEKLSEVRGQMEQQEAEFNALSQQIETVVIAISLSTEGKEQAFGLNWRPGYQLKLALRDGLESLATYAAAMTTILFYLPSAILWVGTIGAAGLALWRLVRWVRRRLGWTDTAAAAQG
jgi:hypothetical protein